MKYYSLKFDGSNKKKLQVYQVFSEISAHETHEATKRNYKFELIFISASAFELDLRISEVEEGDVREMLKDIEVSLRQTRKFLQQSGLTTSGGDIKTLEKVYKAAEKYESCKEQYEKLTKLKLNLTLVDFSNFFSFLHFWHNINWKI